jgi:integrase
MGRGLTVTLRYVQSYANSTGTVYHYFRRGSYKVALPGQPGSPEFMLAYQEAVAAYEARKPKAPPAPPRMIPGSVNAAVASYVGSAAFQAGAPDTRRTRLNILERWRREHGEKRIVKIEKIHIERMVAAKAKTPSAARNFLNTLRALMEHCVLHGMIPENPAIGVRRPQIKTTGYKTWPEEHIAAYRARHPIGTRARLALELLISTGAARADVIRLGRQHVRNGVISFRRHKTTVLVEIPVLPAFVEALEAMSRSDRLTFLVTTPGKQFSDAGFTNWFRDRCREAGIPTGYSAHGVRKYAATYHADCGATAHELMSWFGWLTIREAERYTREAARRKLAMGMVERLR